MAAPGGGGRTFFRPCRRLVDFDVIPRLTPWDIPFTPPELHQRTSLLCRALLSDQVEYRAGKAAGSDTEQTLRLRRLQGCLVIGQLIRRRRGRESRRSRRRGPGREILQARKNTASPGVRAIRDSEHRIYPLQLRGRHAQLDDVGGRSALQRGGHRRRRQHRGIKIGESLQQIRYTRVDRRDVTH